MTDDKKIKINCTGEIVVKWRELKDLQTTESGKKLKATDDEKIDKLVRSLIEFGLVNNLQIWINPKDKRKYCFDAHHRRLAFERLEKMGYKLPPIPATRCLAKDKATAKRLLIIKESKSSWVISDTVEEYLEEVGFNLEMANDYLDLPDIDFDELIEKQEIEVDDLLDSDFILPSTEIKGREIFNKITIFVSDEGKKTVNKTLKDLRNKLGDDIRIMK